VRKAALKKTKGSGPGSSLPCGVYPPRILRQISIQLLVERVENQDARFSNRTNAERVNPNHGIFFGAEGTNSGLVNGGRRAFDGIAKIQARGSCASAAGELVAALTAAGRVAAVRQHRVDEASDEALSFFRNRFLIFLYIKVDAAGKEAVLHSVGSGTDGSDPLAGPLQDSAGNILGTTVAGGSLGFGTVYKVDRSGIETVIYSFTAANGDGYQPRAGLIAVGANL